MSIESIMTIQTQRKQRKKKVYNDIYDKVKMRINHYTKFGQVQCTYEVPSLIYGLPHVNITEITDYIEEKLKDEGFGITRLSATTIYISWEETVILEQIRRNKLKKQERAHERELTKLEESRNRDLMKSLSN